MNCIKCGRTLSPNEIGLHKKLINRGATEYCCIYCLSKHFGVSVERLQEKIVQFREAGCTLFTTDEIPLSEK